MKGISSMMATNKMDLEHQVHFLQRKLELQGNQLMLQKSILEMKDKEVGAV
jgi:hypothetical protein